MDKSTQQPVAWMVYNGWRKELPFLTEEAARDFVNAEQLHSDLSGSLAAYRVVPTFTVPRDVLMALAAEVRDATYDAVRESGLYPAGSDLPDIDIAAIADRYASHVQPEPVNQQLLRTLHHIEGAAKDIRVERHHIASAARAAIDAAMQK